MHIEIPGMRIVDRPPTLMLGGDPSEQFVVSCRAAAHNLATTFMNVDLAEVPSMEVAVDGENSGCFTQLLNIDGYALVVCVPFSDEETPDGTGYLYLRAGESYSPWRMATKMLVLPFSAPVEWGGSEAAKHQRSGRIMLYIALATLNNWFPPESR